MKQQMVSCALPATLCSFQKRLNFGGIEEVLPSMWIGYRTLHIIRNGEVTHRLAFLGFLSGFNMPLLTKSRYCSVANAMTSG